MLARILELWPALPDAAERIGTSHLEVLEAATDPAAAAGDDERDRASCRRPPGSPTWGG